MFRKFNICEITSWSITVRSKINEEISRYNLKSIFFETAFSKIAAVITREKIDDSTSNVIDILSECLVIQWIRILSIPQWMSIFNENNGHFFATFERFSFKRWDIFKFLLFFYNPSSLYRKTYRVQRPFFVFNFRYCDVTYRCVSRATSFLFLYSSEKWFIFRIYVNIFIL